MLPRSGLEKSIAVLPFDNFSEDKEDEHFADGIQDDVLRGLAKIGDLKVISRTSVMTYKGKTHNVKEMVERWVSPLFWKEAYGAPEIASG